MVRLFVEGVFALGLARIGGSYGTCFIADGGFIPQSLADSKARFGSRTVCPGAARRGVAPKFADDRAEGVDDVFAPISSMYSLRDMLSRAEVNGGPDFMPPPWCRVTPFAIFMLSIALGCALCSGAR